jgi:hypothetical protein
MIAALDRIPSEPVERARHWLDGQLVPLLHGFCPPVGELHQIQSVGEQVDIRTDPDRHNTPGEVWIVVYAVEILLPLIMLPAVWPQIIAFLGTQLVHEASAGQVVRRRRIAPHPPVRPAHRYDAGLVVHQV